MKKHFLLLFLMALLPLAGWAVDNYYDVTVTPYDASSVWCGGAPTVQRGWISLSGSGAVSNPDVKDAIAHCLIAQTSDGEYGVGEHTYKLVQSSVSNEVQVGEDVYTFHVLSSSTATLTITKFTGAPVIEINQLQYVTSDLTYTGEAQNLLTLSDVIEPKAATATANEVSVPVVYALSADAETWVSDWATLKGTDAGIYHVWYKVANTGNYQGTDPVKLTVDGKEIAKAVVDFGNIISAVVAPATGLTYDGADQALLTLDDAEKPLVNFGADGLLYRINPETDEDSWSEFTTLDAITGKNAGAYAIQFKVPATDNYDNGMGADATTEYHVLINRAEVDEASAVVALADAEATFTFNYAEHTPALTVSYDNAPLTVDDGDIAIAYADNIDAGDATATVTFNNYYLGDDPNVAYTKNVTFTIAPKSLGVDGVAPDDITAKFSASAQQLKYTGSAQNHGSNKTQVVYTVGTTENTLTSGTDYTRSIVGDNVNATESVAEADKPYYLFTGKGNFTGTVKLYVTIAKADLTATVESQNIAFGDDLPANAIGETTIVGLQGTDVFATAVGDITYTYKQNDEVVETPSALGDYSIVATATPANYNVTFTPGTLTIGQAQAYIVPVAKSKLYGAAEPTLTWKVEDAAGNELGNDVLNGTVTLARQEGENVGSYLIYVVSYTAGTGDNYTVANTPGVTGTKTAPFTIFANPDNTLVLKFKDDLAAAKKTKVYDGTTDVTFFTAEDFEAVSGLLNGDEWPITGATIAAELSSANVADGITATATITVPNYPTVEVAPLDFTITKRPVKFTAKNKTDLAYSDKDAWIASLAVTDTYIEQTINDDYLALVTGDVMSDLIQSITAESQNVGDNVLKLTAKTEGKIANYNVSLVDGTLTIGAPAAGGAIALGGDNDLQLISDYAGQAVNVTINFNNRNAHRGYGDEVTETYPWTAGKWTTMVLPFNISVAKLSEKLGYAIVNVIDPSKTEVSGTESKFYGKLTMKGGNGNDTELAANKPFIVKTAENIAGEIDFGSQTIVAPENLSVEAGGGAMFTGTYTSKPVTSVDEAKIWFMNGNEDGWQYIGAASTASWTIVSTEAFIDMSNLPAQAMTFYFEDIDGTVTAISSVDADNSGAKQAAEGWYTLQGVKLESAPTQKGIYIFNGKKVAIQ